jgi:allophanate hydrolase
MTKSQKLQAHYEKIAADGRFNVWLHLVPLEDNLRRLAYLDPSLPLYGQTFAVKDNIDVAGLPTTAACPSYSFTPTASNPVVQALLDAGALCLGKTNMDQFATGLVGTRSPHGAVKNAFVEEYISGGSSSGSSVAVARDHVDFALGTDTAGSGRVPAAFNRLVGLKPTRGLLSTRGVVPACKSLDCVTFFTKDITHARTLLKITSNYDSLDPWSRHHSSSSFPEKPWRIGVPEPHQLFFDGDDSAREAFASAVVKWKSLGHRIETINLGPFLETARLLYGGPWVAERFTAVGEFLRQQCEMRNAECGMPSLQGQMTNDQGRPTTAGLDPTVTKIISSGQTHSATDCFNALHRLQDLKRTTEPIWDQIDFLLLPTAPTCYKIADVEANPVELNSRLGTYTNFVNLLDLCALAIPHGTLASGVPTGPTLIAPAFQDEFLLQAAGHFLHESIPHSPFPISHSPQVKLAVVGAHLKGLPLHHQLVELGARFVRTTRTAPIYKLYALSNTNPPKPGMIRVNQGGASIEVETYALTPEAFGQFVARIPSPLGIGTVILEDGEEVKGFLCEPAALESAAEITALGGWRAYLKNP